MTRIGRNGHTLTKYDDGTAVISHNGFIQDSKKIESDEEWTGITDRFNKAIDNEELFNIGTLDKIWGYNSRFKL
jgi:hypothetical protein